MDLLNENNPLDNKTLDKLKYDLVRDNLVTYDDIEHAQELAIAQNTNIGQILINTQMIKEEVLMKFLEEKLHTPSVDLENYSIDKKCLEYITYQDALRFKILPLFIIEDTLTIAMADPMDLFSIDKIMKITKKNIDPVIASEKSILKKITEYYDIKQSVGDIDTQNSKDYNWQEELHNDDMSQEHIQGLFRAILKQAITQKVHELFFENEDEGLIINFKKNNETIKTGTIPSLLTSSFVQSLKSMCNLDPNVYEIPQLGKLNFTVDNHELTASVSAFPTINGERILIKIYHPPVQIEKLIKNQSYIEQIKNSLNIPGVVLICGSSLSGKTHLIYSILSNLIAKEKNVMTLESIAKYRLKGISQCELNENIGFNLDKAMRFIEFQSPDIIYFEGITTKEGLDFFTSLTLKNKTLITEFLAENMDDLRSKFEFSEFTMFKSVISTLIFIHNQDSIEVFNRSDLDKYLFSN
ncbi:MAG: Flp pilus assembly complex ATPase component TadA [Candidatus Gastranaerophilales bacterium]|nr:Flp pilus assembly complex ATPase component TadA [Candidatus Gastranaerophilales bacterium]